ncbi:MAG: PEGA domain-containing protein [bacterium]|nr:PEGA domain-containing protein [bacterium]
MSKSFLSFLLTLLGLVAATAVVILFAKGYRLNLPTQEIKKTGMLSVKSYPDGAKIILNGKLTSVTNNAITSLSPGSYQVKITKEGFASWEKEVQVFEELVTEIDALLISLTPKLEPLTNTGIRNPALSSDGTKIAYCDRNSSHPGVYVINLAASGPPISLFRTSSQLTVADTKSTAYSLAEKLSWSPDDSEILIKMNNRGFFLVSSPGNPSRKDLPLSEETGVQQEWEEERLAKRLSFLEIATRKLEIPEEILRISTNSATLWSFNQRKFLYRKEREGMVEFHSYNLEDPLPIGEVRDSKTLTLKADQIEKVAIFWHSDNQHVVLVENSVISLLEVDGSNQTEVFAGNLNPKFVFTAPGGDKLVILTSFNPKNDPNLYTVSLR